MIIQSFKCAKLCYLRRMIPLRLLGCLCGPVINYFLDLNIETGYKTLWCDHSQRRNLGGIFIFCILKIHKFWTFLWPSIKGILGVLRLKFDCFLFLLRECHICNLAVLPSNQACLGKACWKLNNTCLLYVAGSFTLHNL